MSTIVSKFGVPAALLVLVLASGYGLSRLGKPYNGIVFNLHKLIGLAAGILLVVKVVRAAPLSSMTVLAVTAAALLFALLVAAGGLLSALDGGGLAGQGSGMRAAVSAVHRYIPYLAVTAAGVVLYLLNAKG